MADKDWLWGLLVLSLERAPHGAAVSLGVRRAPHHLAPTVGAAGGDVQERLGGCSKM